MTDANRHGAKQPERFDPARAAVLDDPARFTYLPIEAMLELLDLADGMAVLDFGAGTGTYALEIARARPRAQVYALDEQPEMLARLVGKLAIGAQVNLEPIGPEQLASLRGRIDRIFALNVLHELGDAALSDIRTLPAPGGRAAFVDWNADVPRPHGPPSDHVYGVEAARTRLIGAGFQIIRQTLFAFHYALVVEPAH